jgi:serine/threonine protein kinase
MFHSLYEVGDLIGRYVLNLLLICELIVVDSRGAFSMVYLCRRKETQQIFAVKVINKVLCVKKKSLRDEIAVLLRVKHPNIISLEEVYESETELLLVMERYLKTQGYQM